MYSPLAMFAFMAATIPSKWEYTLYQLPAGLWSADTACSEEKGNPVILCLKLDSHRGASCPSRHYLIGRRASYISGSMTSFILPSQEILLGSISCSPALSQWLSFQPCCFWSYFMRTIFLSVKLHSSFLSTGSRSGMWNECRRLWDLWWRGCLRSEEDPRTKLCVIILWSE